jgi:hypothetical protein
LKVDPSIIAVDIGFRATMLPRYPEPSLLTVHRAETTAKRADFDPLH